MQTMIKEKRKLHEKLYLKNEAFIKKEIQKQQTNAETGLSLILSNLNIPHLAQNVSKHRSSLFINHKNDPSSQIIHNHPEIPLSEQPKFTRNSLFEKAFLHPTSITERKYEKKSFSNTPPKTDRIRDKTEKVIYPNLNAYIDFLNKKWKDLKQSKNRINEKEEAKAQIETFMKDKRKYKRLFQQDLEQKSRVEKDVSFLNLNFKQILHKLLDSKNNSHEEKNQKEENIHLLHQSNQNMQPFNLGKKIRRKAISAHKIPARNIGYIEDESKIKENIIDIDKVLSIKKIQMKNNFLVD